MIRAFAGQIGLALEGLRHAEEARQAQLEAETGELRAALFSSVTHDLRTPLASIMASVTSLIHGGDRFSENHRTEHLNTILEEADRLNRLVGNLMDLSRLRAGALVPTKVRTSVDEIIESVVGRTRRTLNDRDVRVQLRDDLPAVEVDLVQIDQALTNLIENAAKFSPLGASSRSRRRGEEIESECPLRTRDRGYPRKSESAYSNPSRPATWQRRVLDWGWPSRERLLLRTTVEFG